MQQSDAESLLTVLYGEDAMAGDYRPFLQALGRTMQSHVLATQNYDLSSGLIETGHCIGVDEGLMRAYADVSVENVWFSRGGQALVADGVVDDTQLQCSHEMRRSLYYADFLTRADIEHGMALRLNRDINGGLSVLTINRAMAAGEFDDNDRQLARWLLPHLQNMHALQQRLHGLERAHLTFRATLDQLDEGVFHLMADGTITFANQAAVSLRANGTLLARGGASLVPLWRADALALLQALRGIAHAPGATTRNLRLHDAQGRLGGFLTLCSAPPVGSPWSGPRVAIVAFIRTLGQSAAAAHERLQLAWRLTGAECRLADLLIRGLSLDEAAVHVGVSRNTVRSQLASMFHKTGTHRQGELVALLARVG